jgi:hypothetical protein
VTALVPVPTDEECPDWEITACTVIGHGYHDTLNPCPEEVVVPRS